MIEQRYDGVRRIEGHPAARRSAWRRVVVWWHDRSGLQGIVRTLGPLVVLVLFWQFTASLKLVPSRFYPPPGMVIDTFWNLAYRGIVGAHAEDSLARLLRGAAIGLALGISLGILMGLFRPLANLLEPVVSYFQAIGDIAWLPLTVIWFGFGEATITFVIVYTVAFPVLYNMLLGIRRVPQVMLNAARSLGAGPFALVVEVLIPAALPNLVTGIRTGVGFGWRALIAAEMIVGTRGLGYMIFEARRFSMTDQVIVGMILLGVLWLLMDRLVLAPIERKTIERWGLVERSS